MSQRRSGDAVDRPPLARWAAPVICILLALGTLLVFGQTLRHGFVDYDDQQYVCRNQHIAQGVTVEGVLWAFTKSHGSNWHPLTWLSHMLDCQLFGLAAWGHHFTSVVLHAAVAIILFLVLNRMTGRLWPSAFAVALFAVHPLRVESVAWVSERKDVLSGLFFVLTLAAYARYAKQQFSLVRYLPVLVLFALGLMAKPMLVTLPFLLLLLDYWPLGRWPSTAGIRGAGPMPQGARAYARLVAEKMPLFALAAASCVVTLLAQSQALQAAEHLPARWRIANAAASYVAYLGQYFLPVNLAALYPHPVDRLSLARVAWAFLVLALITAAALSARKTRPFFLVGWLWYLGMLVPVIGLIQAGQQAMADRYTYLPQIGLCIALAWGLASAAAAWPALHRYLIGGAVLSLVSLMACACRQTSYWRDSESLWRHTLACTSDNYVAHNNLGLVLASSGRADEAILHYHAGLRINPDFAELHNNLGVLLAARGRGGEAITHYRYALRIMPDSADVLNNLGLALAGRGQADEAIAQYRKALAICPDHAESQNNLGNALLARGQLDTALNHYRLAVQSDPGLAAARNGLGVALLEKGEVAAAIVQFEKAVELRPDFGEARANLDVARRRRNR